jgi:hypothetical protein
MSQLPDDVQQTWDILKQVAASTLERKRRLGESAVIWQDGRVVITEGDMADANSSPNVSEHDAGDADATTRATQA